MLESILDQLGARLHAELLHDRVFVKGHGARAYREEVRNFLHRSAFREQLQHFALPHSEFFRDRFCGPAKEDAERHAFSDERGDVGLARERPLDGGEEFARRGLAPQVLSRAVEDSGTVTSVLIPWNTCGAYISGVLGVPTITYLPFCFFNILSPILDVLFGFIGFKVPTIPPPEQPSAEPASGAGDGTVDPAPA